MSDDGEHQGVEGVGLIDPGGEGPTPSANDFHGADRFGASRCRRAKVTCAWCRAELAICKREGEGLQRAAEQIEHPLGY